MPVQISPDAIKLHQIFKIFSEEIHRTPVYEKGALSHSRALPKLVLSTLHQCQWCWLQHLKYPGYAPAMGYFTSIIDLGQL